jgi:drug/metabolite transporter (DMT)-like permease
MPGQEQGWRLWTALATIYVVWGSTYLAIRVMVETMPPLLAAGARFATAGTIFWTVLRLTSGAERVRVTRRQLGGAALMGLLLPFGGNGLVTVAEQAVPSGLAALLVGSVPLWVVVMRSLHGERVPRATLAGVAVGFAGVALLVLPGDRPGNAALWGVLVVLAASISWAAGSFYSRRLPLPEDAFASTAFQMLLGGAAMIAVGLMVGEAGEVRLSAFSGDSVLAFAYLIVAGSLLAFTAYVWLLRNAPISTVATYAYVNPVIAVTLGVLVAGERFTPVQLMGGGIVLVAVVLVVAAERPSRKRRGAVAASTP